MILNGNVPLSFPLLQKPYWALWTTSCLGPGLHVWCWGTSPTCCPLQSVWSFAAWNLTPRTCKFIFVSPSTWELNNLIIEPATGHQSKSLLIEVSVLLLCLCWCSQKCPIFPIYIISVHCGKVTKGIFIELFNELSTLSSNNALHK